MEIRLEDKNSLRSLSEPNSVQRLSQKYKIDQNREYPHKNVLDNDCSHYEYVGNSETYCSICKRKSTIFDYNTGEIIWSICGMVIHDYMESLEPEWRTFSDRGMMEISKKIRTGRPISLALYDMGLSTPHLLGFIFDVISKVLNRLNDIPLTDLPRMADWAQLGEVISRCLGYPEGAFLKAYQNNLAKQNQHALEASQVAQAMIRLMQKRMSEGFGLSVSLEGIHYFKGSMTELRKELNQIVEIELDINIKDKTRWPHSSQALGNKIGEAATNLREVGIIIERPENKSNHSKDVILIKQDVSNGERGTSH